MTLTTNTEYDRMKSDVADMYGSEVLYFVYEDGKYVGCYDNIDGILATLDSSKVAIYEAKEKVSNRIF